MLTPSLKYIFFKSKIIESKNEDNFVDLMNSDDESTKLNDHLKHKRIM